MLLVIDTETTGLNLFNGCKPFHIETLTEDGKRVVWSFPVDPFTRNVQPDEKSLQEIEDYIQDKTLVGHNLKFDLHALSSIGVDVNTFVDWSKVQDTILLHHCLYSNHPHGLKDIALTLLGIDTEDQATLREATIKARLKAKKLGWKVGESWGEDMWLPSTLAQTDSQYASWSKLVETYCHLDCCRTLALYQVLIDEIKQQNLIEQYETRRKLIEITYKMESYGVSLLPHKLRSSLQTYQEVSNACHNRAKVASGVENLNSPKQLQEVLFSPKKFNLQVVNRTKTNQPSTDAKTLETLYSTIENGKAKEFLNNLLSYRRTSKAVEYLTSYQSLAVQHPYRLVLHPSFNITGTDTTRLSSSNPNAQNISKKEDFNLRKVFGPSKNRKWVSIDYDNIELRIFAYACGDKNLIKAFEQNLSVHLIISEVLYPQEYKQCEKEGVSFKKKYESTYYQWIKNGNFALIYGASPNKADETYHVKGAYDKIRKRLPLIDKFIQARYAEVNKFGYVTTLGGYRLIVPKNEPHKASNYFVQGSAGWIMIEGMIASFNAIKNDDCHIIMQVHDELNFDCHKSWVTPPNLDRLKLAMESPGIRYSIPTTVSVDLVNTSWDEA